MKNDLETFIESVFASADKERDIDDDYQQTFSDEGGRKANYIIEDLNFKQSLGKICVKDLCYLSIGGADGSEIEYILKNTNISKGVLVEISDSGVAQAIERARAIERLGKELIVIKGDALAELETSLIILENWLQLGEVKGLVVSTQAVLHELPKRSPNFNFTNFFGKIYRNPNWVSTLFYAREPCEPIGWPSEILLKIGALANGTLCKFALYVRDCLQMTGQPEALSSNWLRIESALAIETLHKLIRATSLERLGYELEEQLTDFRPFLIKAHLETLNEGMTVDVDYVTTIGFKHALTEYEVKFVGINSEPLPVPKTHVEIIGVKSSYIPFEPTEASIVASEEPHFDLELPINFIKSLDGDISEEQVFVWLNQFQPNERPLLLKLLSVFTYVSWKKINLLTIELFDKIKASMPNGISDVLFVPLGSVSKSGGMIAYFFRINNKLREDQFVTCEKLMREDYSSKSIVFLDDLLATGHQAVQLINSIDHGVYVSTQLAVLVSTERGTQYFIEKTGIDVISPLQILRSDLPLNSNNSLFATEEDRLAAKKVLEKYGNELAPLGPLGYAGSELFLAFAYNVPDNSLPIFWSAKNGWTPLFNSSAFNRVTG